jgi:hypothetical protein
VRFRFLNQSAEDIHATVAFPLPPTRTTEHWNVERQLLATFRVQVNGRSVPTTTVRKAVIADNDVTAQLRELGYSDRQIFDTPYSEIRQGIHDLTTNQRAALEKLGGGAGQFPPWKVAVTMVWQQIFPAGKEIVVEHSYAPIVGAVYTVPFWEGSFSKTSWLPLVEGKIEEACLNEMIRRDIKRRVRAYATKNPKQVCVTLHHVEYILGTGRNWKGPIGEFSLRIEKETPDQLISLCFPGKPKKVSPTVHEFYQQDFVPQDRLVVYFYTVGPEVIDPHYLPSPVLDRIQRGEPVPKD